MPSRTASRSTSVETDKATLDVEAPASGVLRRVTANPGDVVKVLSAIAVIEVEAEVKVEAEAKTLSLSLNLSLNLASLRLPTRAASGRSRRRVAGRSRGHRAAGRDHRAGCAGVPPGIRDQGSGIRDASQESVASDGCRNLRKHLARGAADGRGSRPGLASDRRHRPARTDHARGRRGSALGSESESSGSRGKVRRIPDPRIPDSQSPASLATQHPPSSPSPASAALIAERMVAGHSQTAPVTLTSEADATALVELRRQVGRRWRGGLVQRPLPDRPGQGAGASIPG